jgi:hypothetical protein
MVTRFDATLGMGGWLNLTQQGLSPCKKYIASWRSSVKNYRIINLEPFLYLFYKFLCRIFKDFVLQLSYLE